jgi:putative membrane protein
MGRPDQSGRLSSLPLARKKRPAAGCKAFTIRGWNKRRSLDVWSSKRRTLMKKLTAAFALFMIPAAAFAQSAAETTGINSTLGIPPKTEDFVKEASMSDIFEIESSKLALQSGNAGTKAFAQQMIDDHQKTSNELKALVDSGKVQARIATGMSDAQKTAFDKLKDLSGKDFDESYQDDQEDAHEDAVDLFKRYAAEGDNPELKAWAAKTVPALEHHLKMAEELDGK